MGIQFFIATPGPVHNWMGDRLGPPSAVYTRTCVQRCRIVGLRVNQMARQSELELDVK